MVITPHPDDMEIGCGGTLAHWAKQGTEVYVVLCTDGASGSSDRSMDSERLRKLRNQEELDACRALGVKELVTLNYPDGGLEDTEDFLRDAVRAIRKLRPEVVLCQDPYRRQHQHRDHRKAATVALDAVYPYARDHLHFSELANEGLEPHKVGTVLMWAADEQDTFIDISDAIEEKVKALLCHKSQIRSEWEGGQFLREMGRRYGLRSGYDFAEAFRSVYFSTR
jgi:LmbE family N-acetylglucosaminyl deacetylase